MSELETLLSDADEQASALNNFLMLDKLEATLNELALATSTETGEDRAERMTQAAFELCRTEEDLRTLYEWGRFEEAHVHSVRLTNECRRFAEVSGQAPQN